jgi:hypothetical protein
MVLEVIPGSAGITYKEQVEMLPPEYEVPFAIEELTKNILYYRRNNTSLNWGWKIRCQDVPSLEDNHRAHVFWLEPEKLHIGRYPESGSIYCGITASRKYPKQIAS